MEEWLIEIGIDARLGFDVMSDAVLGIVIIIYTFGLLILVLIIGEVIIKSYYKMFRSLFKKKKLKEADFDD
jgi:hypothetical protein